MQTLKTAAKEVLPCGMDAFQSTLGFTIENIYDKLPDFGEDPLLLGWMFFFVKEKDAANPGRHPITDIDKIRVKELRLVTNGNRSYQMRMVDPPRPFVIKPWVHLQEHDPAFLSNTTARSSSGTTIEVPQAYDRYMAATQSGYLPHTDPAFPCAPLIENLEEYQSWADAAYLRATDLRLLKTYISGDAAGYGDVFFSGAELDYSTLHNARLRVEQRHYELDDQLVETNSTGKKVFKKGKTVGTIFNLPPGNKPYLDSSAAFTLKAEPIVRKPWVAPPSDKGDLSRSVAGGDPDGNGSGDGNGNGSGGTGGGDGSGTSDGYTVSGESMPGAFTLVNCPKLWRVMQAVMDEAARITGDPEVALINSETASQSDMEAMLEMLNDAEPPTDPAAATWFAQLLRDLADLIDSTFGPTS